MKLIGGLLFAAALILGANAPVPQLQPRPQVAVDHGAVERYLTHISTDKPIYRTGEKIYVRGVVLRANDHLPMTGGGPASFEIKGPKGDTVASGFSAITDSVAGFSWDIPAGQPGGEYTVRILHPTATPSERKFDIRAYRAPRLKSQIVFARDGYGPGDTVNASVHVERAEGGIPAGAGVFVTARVDGVDTWRGETTVDASGNAAATFKLPAAIARGEGVIAMIIQDGGTVETASKTIPILLHTIDVAIYPEGGDLIAGLPNRIYVEGKTPAQKPADMSGIVVNAAGKKSPRSVPSMKAAADSCSLLPKARRIRFALPNPPESRRRSRCRPLKHPAWSFLLLPMSPRNRKTSWFVSGPRRPAPTA
jgi:hypothetical protein